MKTNVSISLVAEKLKLGPNKYEEPCVLIEGEFFHAHLWLNRKSSVTALQRTCLRRLL